MIIRIARSSQSSQMMYRRSERSYGNATRTIGTIVYILKRSYGNTFRRLRRSWQSKAIPEIITYIPVIDNKFGLDSTEVKKIIQKCPHSVLPLFETRESPWHQVLDVILCLRGTLLVSQDAAKWREKVVNKARVSLSD